jgi:[ribosomal protein S5]-alanine N-acetyltransferase
MLDSLPMRSDRALLRRMRELDAAAFHDYRSDPVLAMYQGWSPMSQEQAAAFVREMATVSQLVTGDWIQLAIADPTTDQLIGDIGIFLDDAGTSAEIGFTLHRANHGRGVATAAVRSAIRLIFATSRADAIRATTDARNLASIRLLERIGFEKVSERSTEFKGEACVEHDYVLPRHAANIESIAQ